MSLRYNWVSKKPKTQGIILPKHIVCKDRTIITVCRGGRLEIRGHGWGRPSSGRHPHYDRVRICQLDNYWQALRVAILLKLLINEDDEPKD